MFDYICFEYILNDAIIKITLISSYVIVQVNIILERFSELDKIN